jgi:hypothetical protein
MARVLLVVGSVSFALVEGFQSRSSAAAHWTVGAAIVVGLTIAVVFGRGRQRTTSRAWAQGSLRAVTHVRTDPLRGASSALWIALIAAAIAWDAYSFSHRSNRLPTLSRVLGGVTRYPLGRAAVVLAWLGLGFVLIFGQRTERGTP